MSTAESNDSRSLFPIAEKYYGTFGFRSLIRTFEMNL